MRSPVRELEARVHEAKTAGECLAALLDLANLHAAEFRNREGLRSAREALNIARTRNDTVGVGRALAAATLCHYQRGDYVSAVATGLDAVTAYADADRPGRSTALQSIALALHCPLGPIALAASLQLDFCTPNCFIQEQSLGIHYNQGSDLLDYLADSNVFHYQGGYVPRLSGPGLGIELDEAKIRAAAEIGHRWRGPIWRNADGSIAEW